MQHHVDTLIVRVVYEDDPQSSHHGYGILYDNPRTMRAGWISLSTELKETRSCMEGDVKSREILKHITDSILNLTLGLSVKKKVWDWKVQ